MGLGVSMVGRGDRYTVAWRPENTGTHPSKEEQVVSAWLEIILAQGSKAGN